MSRALAARFLFKRWRSIVFVDDAPREGQPVQWPPGYRYRFYSRSLELTEPERAALQRAGAADFLFDLGRRDGVYVVWSDGQLASYGAVMRRGPQHSVLGLPDDAVLIGLCETLPGHRLRGLYGLALAQTAQVLRQQGPSRTFVEVLEDNVASIKGIIKAGFSRWQLVEAEIWFGCLVRRSGRWHRLVRGD